MNNKEIIFTLKTILLSKDQQHISLLMKNHHPADMVVYLQEFELQDLQTLFALMTVAHQASLFGYFSPVLQFELAQDMPEQALGRLMQAMPHDERADLFNQLDADKQSRLLPAMAKAEREDICKLAAYSEGKVGSIMTSDYAILTPKESVAQALQSLRQSGTDKETIYQLYVVNDERQLLGTVSLRELIMATPETLIENIMTTDPVFVRADAPNKVAAEMIAKYDLMALPVINGGEKLVGIVTYDDAMDVMTQEDSIEFRKTAAVGNMMGSIKDASINLLYRKRVFWLVLLVFGNIFSGAGIAYFEDTIEAYIALVFFLPLLVDSGGNAGSQSATLMVRALATGEVLLKDWASMLGREVIVAGLLGLTMALAVSTLGIWRGGPEIALVVALTMQIVVVVGSVIGMSLPFVLSKFKLDPAAASAPLITSIADAVGVVIYFAMATWILGIPAA